jgi:protein-tyrosine phosphatase/Fe-S-cluster containining protein
MTYSVTWLTGQLACGSAPMSYDDLDTIRGQGIDAIVNLCGEFCDLHQIERDSGFEVYYLPIPDECAPDMQLMEAALDWLDEALYLRKKILIHCRHGLGRTGTFVSAYLLRRGFGLKLTEKKLKSARMSPGSFSQWRLLRKYEKQKGMLRAVEPSLENRVTVNLQPFLHEFDGLLREAERTAVAAGIDPMAVDFDTCCHSCFQLELIEAVHLSHSLNREFSREDRTAAIERAVATTSLLREREAETDCSQEAAAENLAAGGRLACPLLLEGGCAILQHRPLRCRSGIDPNTAAEMQQAIRTASRQVFLALTGEFSPVADLRFSIFDTVSGRFVQQYFQMMLGNPCDSGSPTVVNPEP